MDIVNLRWDYDHEIDPLDLAKVCVLLCTDTVNVQNLTITSLDQPKYVVHLHKNQRDAVVENVEL